MTKEPIEAFEWLLSEFRRYMHGEITWVEVRDLLREAEQLRAQFRPELAVESGMTD